MLYGALVVTMDMLRRLTNCRIIIIIIIIIIINKTRENYNLFNSPVHTKPIQFHGNTKYWPIYKLIT